MSFGLGPNPPSTNSLNNGLFGIIKPSAVGVPLEGDYCTWIQLATFRVPITKGTALPESIIINEKNCIITFNNNRGDLWAVKVCGSGIKKLASTSCFIASFLEMRNQGSAACKYAIYLQANKASAASPKLFIFKCGALQACSAFCPSEVCLFCGQAAISQGGKFVVVGAICKKATSNVRLIVFKGSPGTASTTVRAVEGCFASYSKFAQVCFGPFATNRRRVFVDECNSKVVSGLGCSTSTKVITANLNASCLVIKTESCVPRCWGCETGSQCTSLTGRYTLYFGQKFGHICRPIFVVKDGALLQEINCCFGSCSCSFGAAISWSGKFIAVVTHRRLIVFKGG